jgi:phage shock protein PspC (stress-responsive transcriptional regulator)
MGIAGGLPVRPGFSLRVHPSIIAARLTRRIRANPDIGGTDIRVQPGIFPMARPGIRRQAERMNTTTRTESLTTTPDGPPSADRLPQPPLSRPREGRMLAGVATGIARYLGADVTVIRVILAVLAIAGPGIPVYLAGWLLIPEEGASQSIAADLIESLRSGTRA